MELVIEPEPDPAGRDALELALVRLLERKTLPDAYLSEWRRAGIYENVETE